MSLSFVSILLSGFVLKARLSNSYNEFSSFVKSSHAQTIFSLPQYLYVPNIVFPYYIA